MKKIVLSFIFSLSLILPVLADVTYSAKSTITEENAQEIINLDVIPIIDINQKRTPLSINNNSTYVAPVIQPAQPDNPTLNFNLNNLKNIKKGGLLPKDNMAQTITNIVQYFNAPYDKVFSHLLGIIDSSELELISFDTKSGRIFANYQNQKPVYITVSQYNSSNVMVKITPADGVYDLPASLTNKIFDDLKGSLFTN